MSRFEELGFKAGLEIHQQLSGTKLFCACPTVVREDEPDFEVVRELRASAGESGAVDVAAAHEHRKQKRFVYQGYQDSTCLVELDEEPVSAPSSDALEAAVVVAELLSMKRFDAVHVMRKVVVDGSNTSGFQRTMAVASDGVIGGVRVDRLCLEEDSCRVVSRGQERDVYNLSRLGIPLLEITTKPDITSPQHLQEVASELGMVLRSTGRVKRGLGTIRQDVNISIAQGARVEIKGVQDLEGMPLLAENEVLRQEGLIAIKDKITPLDEDTNVTTDVTACFKTAKGWVGEAIKKKEKVVGMRVAQAKGLFGTEFFAGYRFGTEVAGYAKANGFGGIIHSDEKPSKYGLDSWDAVNKKLKVNSSDAFILLVSKNTTLMHTTLGIYLTEAINEIARAGVPSCVRKDNGDGTTTYLRPMPGAARMYPETDVRRVDVSSIEVELPELLTDKAARLSKEYSVSEDVAWQVCRQDRAELFEAWASRLPASLVADVLVVKEKELRRRHEVEFDVEGIAQELFKQLDAGVVSKSAVEDALVMYAKKGSVDWASFKTLSEDEVRKVIKEVVAADPEAPFGALMGAAMGRLGGKADGQLVSKLLREEQG